MTTVYVPGTCGELVQGLISGSHFLVSCPVDLFAKITVELTAGGEISADPALPKARAAARIALLHFGQQGLGARINIESPLPPGKGLGSSTADVAGVIYALARAAGTPAAPQLVARLALSVEPTNSSLFPNLTIFDHRQGTLYEDLGPPPPADILILDCGGQIDTVAYNAVDRSGILSRLSTNAAQALACLRQGLRRSDLEMVGIAATRSAFAHQQVLPKAPLGQVHELGRRLGAVGVCVGHSGTVIGVIFPPGTSEQLKLATTFQQTIPGLAILGWQRLIGGGCYAEPPVESSEAEECLPVRV